MLRFPGEVVQLPLVVRGHAANVIAKRRSSRDIGSAVRLDHLTEVLVGGVGHRGPYFTREYGFVVSRNYPSAGSRHSLELFVEAQSVDDLPKGFYHFSAPDGNLTRVASDVPSEWLNKTMDKPAVILYIVSLASRVEVKYPNSIERFSHIEAGHLAQNMLLLCAENGVNAVPIGADLGRRLSDYVMLPSDASFVYALAIGGGLHTPVTNGVN
jgi:SagB-type dehydrogenase family enzyme